MSKAIILVGNRGTGKTTKAKQLIAKAHPNARLILDVYGDYYDLFPKPPIPFKQFIQIAKTVKGAVILIEESTIYLSNRGYDGDVVDLLVKLRNNGNMVIMVYHSLRSIPQYIYQMTNILILHKTNDNADDIKNRFDDPQLVEHFEKIKAAPWLTSTDGKRYSPSIEYVLF